MTRALSPCLGCALSLGCVLSLGCTAPKAGPELGRSAVIDRAHDAQVVMASAHDASAVSEQTRDGSAVREPDAAVPVENTVSDGIACFIHMSATCERSAVCRRLPQVAEGCLALARQCPKSYLPEGSTRSNEGLRACAEEFLDFDCEKFLRGQLPECATPGTRPGGAPCEGHMACASAMCDVDETGERTCFALAESGGMCAERTMCPPGEQCEDGACAEITTLELDSGNAPQSAVGEPCYETSFCEQGLFCRFASDEAVGECAAPPRAEAPCASDRAYAPNAIATICDWTSYCADDGVCRVLPPVGTECAVRNDGKVPVCNSGGYCDTEQGLCLATKGANEACSLPTAFSTTSGVPLAPECDETQNLRCVCLAEHASCGPGEGVCRQGVRPGGSCAFETAMCLYGSQCLGGVCDYP